MLEEIEIDLWTVIGTILRYWKWIVGLTLLAAVAAFISSSLQPAIYEAEAGIAIVPTRTDVEFTSRIVTLSEDELGSGAMNWYARRDAFLALATSNDVAVLALDELHSQPGLEQLSAPALRGMVSAESLGDLILIRVRHGNPDSAAAIANAWARAYVRHVNSVYGAGNELSDTFATQVESAKQSYDVAQAAVEAFVGNNRLDALQREIAERQGLLQIYQGALDQARALPASLQIDTQQQMLKDYYQDLRDIERALADLQALRSQLETGSDSAVVDIGNALAMISLQNRGLGGSSTLPVQIQLDLTSGGLEKVNLSDVDDLIKVLETRRQETQTHIDALVASLGGEVPSEGAIDANNPFTSRVDELNAEILNLQQELSVQQAQQRELNQTRDLAWDTYQTLLQKQAELGISSQITETEVRLASTAVPPKRALPVRRMFNTAAGGMVGLMIGVLGAFGIELWRQNRGRIRREKGGPPAA
jgi:succinoglycan biosynthesis transport protein ExoP